MKFIGDLDKKNILLDTIYIAFFKKNSYGWELYRINIV